MQIDLVQADITTLGVDAIVNAANSSLLGGGGVDGAIHRAGGPAILAACREIRRTTWPDGLPTGQAVATTGGALPARWVIHTVGPVYSASEDRSALLRSAYAESLAVADDLGVESLAFPLVSAGVYGWPKADAVRQALAALSDTSTRVGQAILVLFDAAALELARAVRNTPRSCGPASAPPRPGPHNR